MTGFGSRYRDSTNIAGRSRADGHIPPHVGRIESPSRITRRDAIFWMATQSALFCGASFPLHAQSDEHDRTLHEAIGSAITQGARLRREIVAGAIPVRPRVPQWINRDLAYRGRLAQAFEFASPEDVSRYVLDEFIPVYNFVVAADVPSIPSVVAIQSSAISTACAMVIPDRTSPATILADIVFDALGVTVDGRIFMQFLENEPHVRDKFNNLITAISTQKWSEMANMVDELLRWLIVGGGIRNIVEFLKTKEISTNGFIHRIGWRISLRFVPIVGWIYLGIAIVLAIKANLHRFSGDATHSSC